MLIDKRVGEHLRGYLDALDDARIPFDPDLVMVGRKLEERVTEEVARMVALIGFDDSAWAAVMGPPLTMIEQPMHDLGAKAAQVLLDGIRGGEPVRETHTLRSRLVERASVAPPPAPPG
ncbi:substrate-binding domain-containing protein [Microbispora sp. NBC_01189]|uniref:substrate-binding domain-containing protein n=1 Tax=Microbispora sp. NBC_01189 TaxID=2903583 RepID=UPI002E14CCBE|nr:substrate-binding domain-containing protein [Microbispora sp. NBC_01189]